ncbi:MAG TPA: DoxX family membrane protein [Candidatus Acidoferrales bacterium]
MKIAVIIARILVGLLFVVFGANTFLNFIPSPPLPPGAAGQFLASLVSSHYVMVIGAAEILGGLLLLIGRFVPLGLTFLGPVLVNILSYHLLMSRQGLAMASVVVLLWFFLFYAYREYFASLFVMRAQPR